MWDPHLVVMSPTMRCNLRCTGCYSGLYTKDGELGRLGNVMPAISVEGYEEETAERRGNGVHGKILEAMARLKRAGGGGHLHGAREAQALGEHHP